MIEINADRLDLMVAGKTLVTFHSGDMNSIFPLTKGYENESKLQQRLIKLLVKVIDALPNSALCMGDMRQVYDSAQFTQRGKYCYKNSEGKYVPVTLEEASYLLAGSYEIFKIS